MSNPELIRQTVQNPIVRELMMNPTVLNELVTSYPQAKDWLKVDCAHANSDEVHIPFRRRSNIECFSRFEIPPLFSRPIIEFESQVYWRHMFTQTGHRNKLTTNARCLIV